MDQDKITLHQAAALEADAPRQPHSTEELLVQHNFIVVERQLLVRHQQLLMEPTEGLG